ncbi:hypothetical protein RchiOBHm_Chr3g0471191 [Rosa chinensis]|uniref:Uncharacterized protein n=1 Tax=Rosa chinensis TaxID=74649 RepID=A0A2P6RB91_ROSCH|nr:hypothetical protein RchiOBHm_Chr3g0471191 [Rosa chinensis]
MPSVVCGEGVCKRKMKARIRWRRCHRSVLGAKVGNAYGISFQRCSNCNLHVSLFLSTFFLVSFSQLKSHQVITPFYCPHDQAKENLITINPTLCCSTLLVHHYCLPPFHVFAGRPPPPLIAPVAQN